MTPQTPLSKPKSRAIDAILSCDTREAAASAARVSVRSLTRWVGEAAFANELSRRRTRLLAEAANVLARGAVAAARCLVGMAAGEIKPSSARAAAARSVLDFARKTSELDELELRLSELEAAAAAQVKPYGRQYS